MPYKYIIALFCFCVTGTSTGQAALITVNTTSAFCQIGSTTVSSLGCVLNASFPPSGEIGILTSRSLTAFGNDFHLFVGGSGDSSAIGIPFATHTETFGSIFSPVDLVIHYTLYFTAMAEGQIDVVTDTGGLSLTGRCGGDYIHPCTTSGTLFASAQTLSTFHVLTNVTGSGGTGLHGLASWGELDLQLTAADGITSAAAVLSPEPSTVWLVGGILALIAVRLSRRRGTDC